MATMMMRYNMILVDTLSCSFFIAAIPLLGLFTIPAEYLSCFCAGTATGDSGVLGSSAECFAVPFPLFYNSEISSLNVICSLLLFIYYIVKVKVNRLYITLLRSK